MLCVTNILQPTYLMTYTVTNILKPAYLMPYAVRSQHTAVCSPHTSCHMLCVTNILHLIYTHYRTCCMLLAAKGKDLSWFKILHVHV